MIRNVYDPKQQAYRVEFAINVILRGANTTRRFDACFEMDDSDGVAARVYRRALKNPRLMAALPRYLNLERCLESYEKVYGASDIHLMAQKGVSERMHENVGSKLENLIEDLYRLTTPEWTDKELEALDYATEEVRAIFRERRLRAERRMADNLRRGDNHE